MTIDRYEIKRRLEIKKKRRSKSVTPEPRYDKVYFNGLNWLNKQ